MMKDGEWGPWIEHDGKGCPCRGMVIEAKWLQGNGSLGSISEDGDKVWIVPSDAGMVYGSAWIWRIINGIPDTGTDCAPIVSYRIRKPQALLDLIRMAEDPVDPDAVPVPAKRVPA
jgi:hypothetical protein